MSKPPDVLVSNNLADKSLSDKIAALTPDTPLDERFALGMAMVFSGSSVSHASLMVDVPTRALWDRVTKLRTPEERAAAVSDAENRLLLQALEAVELATARTLDLMDQDRLRPAEVIKFLQVMRDTVAAKLKWTAPLPPPPEPEKEAPLLKRLLDKLEAGETVKITREKEVKAIEGEVVDGDDS